MRKSPGLYQGFSSLIGQLPTLPHTCACSTIGAERLNFRVRDGNGWDPLAMVTQNLVGRICEPAGTGYRSLLAEIPCGGLCSEYLTGVLCTSYCAQEVF